MAAAPACAADPPSHRRHRAHGPCARARRAGLPGADASPARSRPPAAPRSGATLASSPGWAAPTSPSRAIWPPRSPQRRRGASTSRSAAATAANLAACRAARKPLLIGTTGYAALELQPLFDAAAREIPLLVAPEHQPRRDAAHRARRAARRSALPATSTSRSSRPTTAASASALRHRAGARACRGAGPGCGDRRAAASRAPRIRASRARSASP